jgi:hypothetical protein
MRVFLFHPTRLCVTTRVVCVRDTPMSVCESCAAVQYQLVNLRVNNPRTV